ADANNIPVWVTTSQPRYGLSAGASNNLVLFKNWVLQRFGSKAVDFWTDIANADGSVNNYYSAGDGIHINNYGHHVVFTRMLQEKIWDSICLRRAAAVNVLPVANAGADVTLQLPVDTVRLNGSASYDVDGVITQYSWRKLQGGSATIVSPQAMNPLVHNLQAGNYLFELEVTDDSLATKRDTVRVRVNAQPVATAGADASITLPQNIFALNGTGSSDADGNITSYAWRRISGAGNAVIANAAAAQTNVTFSAAGLHLFELTVRDNDAGISKDSVSITVNPDPNVPPVAAAGANQSIQLPINKVLLDGRMSSDPNGSIASYQWSLVSGPQAAVIATPSKDSTTVTFVNDGVYIYRLTVTDNAGLSATDDVQITVLPAPVTTKAIKVNVINAGITYNNTQWNSWNPVANVNSATFKYEDGSQSTVFANLVQGGNFSDNGANYQPSATGCPPEVLRINSMHTIQRSLVISGLNSTKNYSFEFYGSRAFTSNSRSVYRTGTIADTISTDFNGNDVARLHNIRPDNNGRITFTLSIIGSYHYMAGFTITEPAPPTGRAPVEEEIISINNITEVPYDNAGETIIYPNPFKQRLMVKPGKEHSGAKMISVSDAAGKPLTQKNIAAGNSNVVEILLPVGLQKGIYFLQIVSAQKRTIHKLIKH
ncbi:MAG: T9SS type A sorting domain-containing protein, partial [Sphingobacteriales bacterium]